MTRANITMYQVYSISCSTSTYNSSKLHSKPYQNRFIWSAEFHFLKVTLIEWWITYTCFVFLTEWTSCTWPLQSCATPSTTAMSFRCGNMALFLGSSSSSIWKPDLTSKTTSIWYLLCDTIQGNLRHMYKFVCLLKVFLISVSIFYLDVYSWIVFCQNNGYELWFSGHKSGWVWYILFKYVSYPLQYSALHDCVWSVSYCRALVGMMMYNPETCEIAKPSELLSSVKAIMSVLQGLENYGKDCQVFNG